MNFEQHSLMFFLIQDAQKICHMVYYGFGVWTSGDQCVKVLVYIFACNAIAWNFKRVAVSLFYASKLVEHKSYLIWLSVDEFIVEWDD